MRNETLLDQNLKRYEDLVELIVGLDKKKRAETVLECIRAAASLASRHHPGRFTDGRVENVAFEIGQNLERGMASPGLTLPSPAIAGCAPKETRKVLHVATAVRTTGGHTRTILHWINSDKESHHTLLLTGQGPFEVPSWLTQVIADRRGQLVVFPMEAPLLTKARWLRAVARDNDLAILHHFPDDVVPTVALATDDCPPVAILNHTDHLFWLGSTVADAVINLRTIGKTLSEARRFTRSNLVLPIPLNDPLGCTSRAAARSDLGIPEDRLMLLSVGRVEKYVPTETHNFFATSERLLEKNPDAHLYLLGVSEADARERFRVSPHARLHLLGALENASAYQIAADVYLEGFPFGSQTALLEAILAGVPAVPAGAPALDLVATNDDAVIDLLKTPTNEGEYIQAATDLIQNPVERRRLGTELRERIRATHTGGGWLERLAATYSVVEVLAHAPRPIPDSDCARARTDLTLCAWLEGQIPRGLEEDLKGFASGLVFGAAYRARDRGEYYGAWQVLSRSVRKWGTDRQLISAMVKLAPHWLCRKFFGPKRPVGSCS